MRETAKALPSVVLCGVVLLLAPAALANDARDTGKKLYGKYCSACHGPGGKGDGVVSQFLDPKPLDLTRIAKSADGKFPFYDLVRIIDGRETIRAHGDADMPVWGEVFTAEEGDAPDRHAVARGKIVLITDYLESIQVK